MPLELKVNLDVSRYVARLKKYDRKFSARAMLQSIGEETRVWIENVFRTEGEGRRRGVRWRPLRPSTVAAKAAMGRNSRILDSSGELKNSFQISMKGSDTVVVGTDTPWARFHQDGTKGPYFIFPKKAGGRLSFITVGGRVFRWHVIHPGLPKRPFMPTADTQVRIARAAAAQHFREVFGED